MSQSHPTLILAPRVTDDSVKIWRSAREMGWPVERLASWRVPKALIDAAKDYVIYAEPLFAEAVADQLGLILLEPPTDWLVRLPHSLRGRRVALSTLGESRQMITSTFVKPAEGKVFEAKVYAHAHELPTANLVDDSLPVLISEPVSFILEVRCFVANGCVLSASPYWRNDKLAEGADGSWPFLTNEQAEALAFAETVIAESGPKNPPAFVLDVGITREHGWAVVEANPCWGAGLYGCPPSSALQAAQHAILRKTEMAATDWQWTSGRLHPTK